MAAFAVLVLATVGAFFLTDALKVADPLVYGRPAPTPGAINPLFGRICISGQGKPLDYKSTFLDFSVSHTESVGVYMVSARNPNGNTVATISTGTPMTAGATRAKIFTWDGYLDDGRIAPEGVYYFRIVLSGEGRSIDISDRPVQVITHKPSLRVLSVVLQAPAVKGKTTTTTTVAVTAGRKTAATGPVVISPPSGAVKIRFSRAVYRRVWINVYRTDVSGRPQRVAHYAVSRTAGSATWNGKIGGAPAPAGTYLIGITAQDAACDQVTWPAKFVAGTTAGAGVTVRYLTATQPLGPTKAGSRATVSVDSPLSGYHWKLRRAGTHKVLASGSGSRGESTVTVKLPRRVAGLYELFLTSGANSAKVALVASATGKAGDHARVLVVLPMLDWVGQSQVDDTGDGLADTLKAGDPVSLSRGIVNGFPDSFADDVTLLKYLNSQHLSYQLTTDLALANQDGPSLTDRWGVLLPDGSAYVPASFRSTGSSKTDIGLLTGFVKHGGRVLALGTGTLAGTSRITGYGTADPSAAAPVKTRTDIFGAERGPVAGTDGELITELADDLHLFGEVSTFTGFSHYQPIEPPAGVEYSAAGIAERSAAIVAFPDGTGRVVEVGLPDFGASLATNVNSQELMSSVWPLLAKQR